MTQTKSARPMEVRECPHLVLDIPNDGCAYALQFGKPYDPHYRLIYPRSCAHCDKGHSCTAMTTTDVPASLRQQDSELVSATLWEDCPEADRVVMHLYSARDPKRIEATGVSGAVIFRIEDLKRKKSGR